MDVGGIVAGKVAWAWASLDEGVALGTEEVGACAGGEVPYFSSPAAQALMPAEAARINPAHSDWIFVDGT